LFLAGAAIAPRARAQVPDIPGVTSNTEPAPKAESEKTAAAPTADNPEATVAESTGPIAVTDTVSDISVQRKLEKLLPRYPGVRSIEVEVEEGVVTLTGHVADPETRDRLRDFVRRVQGVNLVLNQTKTDAQVMSGRAFALKQLGAEVSGKGLVGAAEGLQDTAFGLVGAGALGRDLDGRPDVDERLLVAALAGLQFAQGLERVGVIGVEFQRLTVGGLGARGVGLGLGHAAQTEMGLGRSGRLGEELIKVFAGLVPVPGVH
jgi:hypothetical protein